MDFEEWEHYYRKILDDFGYDRSKDETSAQVLDKALRGDRIGPERINAMLNGKDVTVAGNAQSLQDELDFVAGVLIAADEATSVLMKKGLMPAIIVTDLDGDVKEQVRANLQGVITVIHAHGDNIEAVKEWAPKFEGPVVGTTQSRPFGTIFNFGGFTDGDRAVLLAHHFKAASIRLLGFDFKTPSPKDTDPAVKKRKLAWARRIIEDVGIRTDRS